MQSIETSLRNVEKGKREAAFQMVHALSKIKGIEAIVLGGSQARGTANQDSDVDLGIYYLEKSPPSIDELRILAERFCTSSPVVTQFYEWGPWVNGGAWINTQAGKFDWLYRNLRSVRQVIEDAKQGRFSWDYRQQPPYGFFSVMFLADLQQNISLYDPNQSFLRLKEESRVFPEPLRRAMVQEHLWSVEFSYFQARKSIRRKSIYETAGCMTRIAAELNQVLFALNRTYFATERTALETIETFSLKPRDYANRICEYLGSPGKNGSLEKWNELIQDTIQLSQRLYTPKYILS